MDPLEGLLRVLGEKLEATRRMIGEFEEGMDYATHCTLQGFAEGIAFAIEEIKERTHPDGQDTDESGE